MTPGRALLLELLADRKHTLALNAEFMDPIEARDAAVALTEAHAIVSPTWVDAPTGDGLWWVDTGHGVELQDLLTKYNKELPREWKFAPATPPERA